MPHLVALYSANLETEAAMTELCRALADTMLAARDESGRRVFPPGGVRVFAYPAPHFAGADGRRDYGFVYLNLRMGRGRSAAVHRQVGELLLATAKRQLDPLFERRHLGLTLQIDEGAEVFDAKHGNIHDLFRDL